MSQDIQELEEHFGKAQAALIEQFKEKLTSVAKDVIGNMYSDVSNWASSDAHTNYHNYLRDEMRASFIKEITSEFTHYSWAHSVRMEMLKHHRDVLQNKIIEDLQDKIAHMAQEINQLHERRY